MVPQGKSYVQQAPRGCVPKSIIPLLGLTVFHVRNNQQGFAGKYLLRFRLTDVVALFAFSSVAFVPIKPGYPVEVCYGLHIAG